MAAATSHRDTGKLTVPSESPLAKLPTESTFQVLTTRVWPVTVATQAAAASQAGGYPPARANESAAIQVASLATMTRRRAASHGNRRGGTMDLPIQRVGPARGGLVTHKDQNLQSRSLEHGPHPPEEPLRSPHVTT